MLTTNDSRSDIDTRLDNIDRNIAAFARGMADLDARLTILASAVASLATDIDDVKAMVKQLAERHAARR